MLPMPARATVSYCDGYAYLTQGRQLLRFDPVAMTATPIRELPTPVNALAASDDRLYALTRPDSRPVALTIDGAIVELGPIQGGPPGGFAGAYVAASHSGSWLLMHDERVFTVPFQPREGGLEVSSEARLSATLQIGDWATDANGHLLTISTREDRASLVRIEPQSGTVEVLGYPAGLPSDSVFGAIWRLGHKLYAWHNSTGGIYELDLTRPDVARKVVGAPAGGTVDAASCEPPTPPPSSLPSPATPSLGGPVQPFQPPPVGQATAGVDVSINTATPPPTPSVAPRPTPSPVRRPTPKSAAPITDQAREVPVEDEKSTRRWVAAGAVAMTLTLLLARRGRGTRR